MAGSTKFPAALDDNSTLYQPGSGDLVASVDHAQLHDNASVAVIAAETKVGIGATAPAANQLLVGTGTGTSAWQGLTSSQLAGIISDETGSGKAVFGTSPTLTTPVIASIVNSGTLTLPTSTDTLVGRATTDTLTNKTLTTPVITWTNNTVTAASLATNAISLANISSSSSQSSITTAVIVTGLTTTVTIPAGGRTIRIEASVQKVTSNLACGITLGIYNSTTVTGSPIQTSYTLMGVASSLGTQANIVHEYTPSPGSQSYCIGISIDAGTGTTSPAATSVNYLRIKAV